MAQSNITGGSRTPQRNPGSRTGVLGPSDTSDSGSDIQGGPGLVDAQAEGLDEGTTSDLDRRAGPGADFGDPDLDADSDSQGTGERALADRDGYREASDIGPDHIENLETGEIEAMSDDEVDDFASEDLAIDDDEASEDGEARSR
jgi:hypothetical protein